MENIKIGQYYFFLFFLLALLEEGLVGSRRLAPLIDVDEACPLVLGPGSLMVEGSDCSSGGGGRLL